MKQTKFLILIALVLFLVTGCESYGRFSYFKVSDKKVLPSYYDSQNIYVVDKNFDDVSIGVEFEKNVRSIIVEQERLNKRKKPTLITEEVGYVEQIPAGLSKTTSEIKLSELDKGYIYKFTITFKTSSSNAESSSVVYLYTYNPNGSNGSDSTQSIQTEGDSDLLNKIGGINQYCNIDENGNYNTLYNTNMFSKITYSQVGCKTQKYSSTYDNGISFINWVLEKTGKTTKLPSTYSEVIKWAEPKMLISDGTRENISAGDLVILGDSDNSPIEIIVKVEDDNITTVGYRNSVSTSDIYETEYKNLLKGYRIIKMQHISY